MIVLNQISGKEGLKMKNSVCGRWNNFLRTFARLQNVLIKYYSAYPHVELDACRARLSDLIFHVSIESISLKIIST